MAKSNLKGIDIATLNMLRTMHDQLHQSLILLEIRFGPLETLIEQFNTNTIKTSAEIQKIRLTIPLLRDIVFNTAHFALYDLENDDVPGVHNPDGEPVLYLGGREHNPIFSNLARACKELTDYNFYVPYAEDTLRVKNSVLRLKRVKLADLNLQKDDSSYIRHRCRYYGCYYEIKTSDYDILKPAQRTLAEEVHGSGKQFVDVMKMLADTGIETTGIYVLNPEYVKEHAQKQAICMVCCLSGWYIRNSFFFADSCDVTNDEDAILGKPWNPTICLTENSEGIVETTPLAVAYSERNPQREKDLGIIMSMLEGLIETNKTPQ